MKVIYGTKGRPKYDVKYYGNTEQYNYIGNDIYDFSHHDINQFPYIGDFEIILVDNEYHKIGNHIKFYSHKNGILADFPWWDHADKDIKNYNRNDIPNGILNAPFDDFEEGWQIVIFEKESFVYVLIGSNPSFSRVFHTWFKVDKHEYERAWVTLIEHLN
ncbi:hypothetical protein [Paenibacillus sp. SYP-B3998]|uniref:hypothetical protein n=1 Tax=Paenibacillus sp. SYP-B3998 TaxID=2678564 RepID=UPI0013D3A674|nr:hypothetical protein [Paenibacillus sp. SYP-B3998]